MLEIKKRKPGRPKNIEIVHGLDKNTFLGQLGLCTSGTVAPNKLDEYLERYQDETKYSIKKSPGKIVINPL